MARGHSLDGLMKWIERDEWQFAFEEVLERHFMRACTAADVDIADLPSILGNEWGNALWGCAFEDFMTCDLDDGRNIVDDYLKRRGRKETAANRAYIIGLRSSVMSLYEASEIVPGESFLARDLIRGGEPVRVMERTATRFMTQWDRFCARIVQVGPKTVIGGGVLHFQREPSDRLLDFIDRVAAAVRTEATSDYDIRTSVLREAAADFSRIWLADLLNKLLTPPQVVNSDGEPLLPSTVCYPLTPEATKARVQVALDTLPALRRTNDTSWDWLQKDEPPASGDRADRRARAPLGLMTKTENEEGTVILGKISLRDRTLEVAVNSSERAERARTLFGPVLSGLAGTPVTDTGPVESLPLSPGLSAEDERAIILETLHRYYTKLIDEPVPALGNMTPKAASQSPEGRKKLADWLKHLENSTAQQPAGSPLAEYSFSWMWEKLGIGNLRR